MEIFIYNSKKVVEYLVGYYLEKWVDLLLDRINLDQEAHAMSMILLIKLYVRIKDSIKIILKDI